MRHLAEFSARIEEAFLSLRNSITMLVFYFSRLLHQCSIVTQKTIQTKEFSTKMKRVGSIKQALKPSIKSNSATSDAVNNNESKVNDSKMNNSSSISSPNRMSILGNVEPRSNGLSSKPDFHLPKSISSFLKKGTLTRNKKDKSSPVIFIM